MTRWLRHEERNHSLYLSKEKKRAGVGWLSDWKNESWPFVSADGTVTE